jgi:hypothetical protein
VMSVIANKPTSQVSSSMTAIHAPSGDGRRSRTAFVQRGRTASQASTGQVRRLRAPRVPAGSPVGGKRQGIDSAQGSRVAAIRPD